MPTFPNRQVTPLGRCRPGEASLGVSESALHCRPVPISPGLPPDWRILENVGCYCCYCFHSHQEHHSQDAQKVNITVKTGHWAVLSRLSAQPLCSPPSLHPHSMVRGQKGKGVWDQVALGNVGSHKVLWKPSAAGLLSALNALQCILSFWDYACFPK